MSDFSEGVKSGSGSSYAKGWHGQDPDPPGGNKGHYRHNLEILNTMRKDISMGTMTLNIDMINKDPLLGEWMMKNMDKINQGFPLV